jgi:hypothetical protein
MAITWFSLNGFKAGNPVPAGILSNMCVLIEDSGSPEATLADEL